MTHHVKESLQARHIDNTSERGETRAYVFVSDEINVQPGVRHFLKPDRHVPRLHWLGHKNTSFANGKPHLVEWRMATGCENASRADAPRWRHETIQSRRSFVIAGPVLPLRVAGAGSPSQGQPDHRPGGPQTSGD